MKLYAVTKGEYSGYHIIAITADKSVAEKLAKQFSKHTEFYCEEAIIEEYEDGEFLVGKSLFLIRVKNGEITQIDDRDDDYGVYDESVHKDVNGGRYTFVVADCAEKAAKIGKDRIMQHIATTELI